MFHIFWVFCLVQLSTRIPDVLDEEAEEDNKEEEDDQGEQEQEVWAPMFGILIRHSRFLEYVGNSMLNIDVSDYQV